MVTRHRRWAEVRHGSCNDSMDMSVLREIVSGIGRALHPVRAGEERLLSARLRTSDFPWMDVSSSDFVRGGPIPVRCTADGDNISPALSWSAVPETARELLLICEDADAPLPKPFVHWIVYRIPPTATELPPGLPETWAVVEGAGLKQGVNGKKRCAYDGPSPPIGHGVHHYHFQLFALREPLQLAYPPDRSELAGLLHHDIVAFGETIGTYERAR